MDGRPIEAIANGLGLTINEVPIEGHDHAYRVLKGANPIFVGTDQAVRDFLAKYERERPDPFQESMIGYKE